MVFPAPPNILDADTAEELLDFFDRFPVLKNEESVTVSTAVDS